MEKKDDNNTRQRRNDHNRDNGRPHRGDEKRRDEERRGEERGKKKERSDENHVPHEHKRRSTGKKCLLHIENSKTVSIKKS